MSTNEMIKKFYEQIKCLYKAKIFDENNLEIKK